MALYGKNRDIWLMKSINREMIHDVIEQQVGYYKPKLDETKINTYGESLNKFWIGPVLIKCLIERGDQIWDTSEFGPDVKRIFKFRFLRDDLICANVVPEVGDVILYSEDLYEVNAIVQNQLILGKDPDYAYSNSVQEFGSSLSIILETNYIRSEKTGIKIDRL